MPKIVDFSAAEEEFESVLDMEDESENLVEGEVEMPFSKNLLEQLNLVGFKIFVEYYNDFSDCDDDVRDDVCRGNSSANNFRQRRGNC